MGRVQPEIHAGNHRAGEGEVILLQVQNAERILQRGSGLEDAADHGLAALVAGVRFARVEDLQGAASPDDRPEAGHIAEQQVGAFVRRGPAGEADSSGRSRRGAPPPALYLFQESCLGLGVAAPDLLERDADRVAEVVVVPSPLRDVPAKSRRNGGDVQIAACTPLVMELTG